MWKKIGQFFAHPQIQIALALGIGIVAQAYVYKRVYHIPVEGIAVIIPGLIVVAYEALIHKKENRDKKFLKPIYWVLLITLANLISILVPLFNK